MGKAPAFQFYVRDWLSDPQLRQASPATRGIWIDLLCYLWEAPERGRLSGTLKSLARMVGVSEDDFQLFVTEAELYQFADVTLANKKLTVVNRRMEREARALKKQRARQKRYMDRQRQQANDGACDAEMTPLSSSSSSTSLKEKNRVAILIYERHPRKGARADAIKNIVKLLKAGKTEAELIEAQDNYIAHLRAKPTDPDYIIQANNFFGVKARWEEFADNDRGPEIPAEALAALDAAADGAVQ